MATQNEKEEAKTTEEAATPKETTTTEWQGSYKDSTSPATQRVITVTETNGDVITAPFNWPGKREAENINQLDYAMEQKGDRTIMRSTPGDLHDALIPHFGQAMVNQKPAGKLSWAFFDEHEAKTFNYFMDQAESFLGGKLK